MVVIQLLVKLQRRTNLQGAPPPTGSLRLLKPIFAWFAKWQASSPGGSPRNTGKVWTRAEQNQLCSRAGLDRRSYSTTEHLMWNDYHGTRKAACKYPRYTHKSAKCEIILCEPLLFCLFVWHVYSAVSCWSVATPNALRKGRCLNLMKYKPWITKTRKGAENIGDHGYHWHCDLA